MQYDHLSIRSILLADDDEDDRLLFEDALNQVRQEVSLSTAEDGHTLLVMLKRPPLPDVVFLDLNMPGKNGFECLQEIRQAEAYRHIPVIIFSTTAQMDAVRRTYDLGANYFMHKPPSFPALKKLLNQVFSLDLRTPFTPKKETFLLYSP